MRAGGSAMAGTTMHAMLQRMSAGDLQEDGWDRRLFVPGAWDGVSAREGMERFLLSYRTSRPTPLLADLGLGRGFDAVWLIRVGDAPGGGDGWQDYVVFLRDDTDAAHWWGYDVRLRCEEEELPSGGRFWRLAHMPMGAFEPWMDMEEIHRDVAAGRATIVEPVEATSRVLLRAIEELYREKHTLLDGGQWQLLCSMWAPFLDAAPCPYEAFYDFAWALHRSESIAGSVRVLTLEAYNGEENNFMLWLASEDTPADPIVLRIRVTVVEHGSCVDVEVYRRAYAGLYEGLHDSHAIEDDWRKLAMAMALHPRLGEKSAARDLEQDAMQMVLSILVRSTPPGRLS